MPIHTVSEGISNQYLVQGIGILVLGFLSFYLSIFIAVPIIVFAVALLFSETGLLIDSAEKRYKKYVSLFGIKAGQWFSFAHAIDIVLVLTSERKTMRGILPGAPPIGRSATIQVRTYDLLLKDRSSTTKINDFLTYKNARIAFEHVANSLGVAGRDFVAEKLASNRAKRSRRN